MSTLSVLSTLLLFFGQVESNAECADSYRRFRNVRITDTKMCAIDPLERGSACQGEKRGLSERTEEME